MATGIRSLAIVTGAPTGIGYELARCCAEHGFDLLIAADEPGTFAPGVAVDAVEVDLATLEGVDKLYAAANGRPIEALLANACRGLGKGFLDQDFTEARCVVDTNITGTIYLLEKVGRDMPTRGHGRMLIAGFMPGTYQAVYKGTKARSLTRSSSRFDTNKGHGCHGHLPHARRTETDFFERADMTDTKSGSKKRTIPRMLPRRDSTRGCGVTAMP
jgi:uncharacterized protein